MRLEPHLRASGIDTLFDRRTANLAGIAGSSHPDALSVDVFIQHARIDVNEQGTDAEATTAVVSLSAAPPRRVVQFDRPFLFFLRDRWTGIPLFVGWVEDPAAS
jgi:serpin B